MTRSFSQGTRKAQGSVKGRRKPWLLPSSLEQGHFDSDGDHIRWPACQSHSWNSDPALRRPQAPAGPSGPGSSSPTSNYSQEKLSSEESEQGLLMPWRCVQHHRASFCCGGSVCRNLRPDMPGHSPACLPFSFRDLPPALPELMKRQTIKVTYRGLRQTSVLSSLRRWAMSLHSPCLHPTGRTRLLERQLYLNAS